MNDHLLLENGKYYVIIHGIKTLYVVHHKGMIEQLGFHVDVALHQTVWIVLGHLHHVLTMF